MRTRGERTPAFSPASRRGRQGSRAAPPRLPTLGLGTPPASWPELLRVQMALRGRRTSLRWPSAGLVAGTPENQEPDCAQLGEGAVVQQQDLCGRLTVGSWLGTRGATTSPTIPAVAPGDQGLREGLCRRGTPCDPRGVRAGDSGSIAFALQPGRSHAQAQVCQAATSPGPAVRAHPTVGDVLFPLPATARG